MYQTGHQNILRPVSGIRVQHQIKLAVKIDGYDNQQKGYCILQEQQKHTCTYRTVACTDRTYADRRLDTGKTEIRIKRSHQRQKKQQGQRKLPVECRIGKTEPTEVFHRYPGKFNQSPGKQDGKSRQQQVLHKNMGKHPEFSCAEYPAYAVLMGTLEHKDQIKIDKVQNACQQQKYTETDKDTKLRPVAPDINMPLLRCFQSRPIAFFQGNQTEGVHTRIIRPVRIDPARITSNAVNLVHVCPCYETIKFKRHPLPVIRRSVRQEKIKIQPGLVLGLGNHSLDHKILSIGITDGFADGILFAEQSVCIALGQYNR